MNGNIDKRIPLNLDIDLFLSHFEDKLDVSEYEERRKRRAEYKAKWAREHRESRRKSNSKYNHSEKGKETYRTYAANNREQLNANSRAYYQKHLEDMRRRGRERYYRRKAETT